MPRLTIANCCNGSSSPDGELWSAATCCGPKGTRSPGWRFERKDGWLSSAPTYPDGPAWSTCTHIRSAVNPRSDGRSASKINFTTSPGFRPDRWSDRGIENVLGASRCDASMSCSPTHFGAVMLVPLDERPL